MTSWPEYILEKFVDAQDYNGSLGKHRPKLGADGGPRTASKQRSANNNRVLSAAPK
jgi:hypothetical protein